MRISGVRFPTFRIQVYEKMKQNRQPRIFRQSMAGAELILLESIPKN